MDVGLGVRCEQTGLYMDTRTDKIIKPNKNYFHSKMWFKEREDTTLYVQCHIRAWFERRMHPKKPKDFDILYNELEAWRLNETKKIRSSTELNVEEKNLALQQLLNKETKILQ